MQANERHSVAFQAGEKQQLERDVSTEELAAFLGERCPHFVDPARERIERVKRFHKDILPNPDKLSQFVFLCQARAKTDAILNTDLEGMSHDDIVARVNEYHLYTDIGSTVLWRDKGFSGAAKFFSAPWPVFSWKPYKFNDQASSAAAWGINILFRGTWWRTEGQNALWLIGLPYVEFRDLGVFGFDEIASSYLP